ncbi:MAG: prenyltransferase/squalene oxidase repeat-containing protein [Planctomycetota bacterium]
MVSTRQLVIAAIAITLAIALPFSVYNNATAGGKDTPNHGTKADKRLTDEQPAPPQAELADAGKNADDQTPDRPSSAHLLVDPKPLSDAVKKGLAWLASQQLENGGWGQGEESLQMRGNQNSKNQLADTANVGDTSAAALTLIRSGSTPSSGKYDINLRKAVAYVCESVEAAGDKDLYVTRVRNTRLQAKLGTYVDTFLAAQMLSEVKGKMASDKANERVDRCLDKVVKKIEAHQTEDGKFGGRGWAMALNDAIANKAINQAAQVGAEVDPASIERARLNARALSAPASPGGKFAAAEGTAGIELYGAANSVSGQREVDTTYRQEIEKQRANIRAVLEETRDKAGEDGESKAIKAQADRALKQLDDVGDDIRASEQLAESVKELTLQLSASSTIKLEAEQVEGLAAFGYTNTLWADNRSNLEVAQKAVVTRLEDDRFVAGFGNNGGEEFLSYTRIGESLYLEGGEAWETFDKKMTKNLTNVQNKDGSWSGHHCITGRTFCTATALSVLMTDRMHVPEELLEAARAELVEQDGREDQPEEAE